MIFKRRADLCILLSLCCSMAFVLCHTGDDFRFDTDDLQVVYSDPPETVITPPSRYLYAKELAQCPLGESKMMMTLLLRSLKWSDIGEKKKEKAIKKMSRFFLVPTKFIKTDDIHTSEMLEMLKHSINKSNNLLNTKETVGRVEFMIGCGDTIFANSKALAHKVNEYVKSGKLEELSGLPFQWWNIWAKHVKSRVQRMRRQADDIEAGSGLADRGEDQLDDDEYEYDDGDTDGETEGDEELGESENEQQPPPSQRNNNQRKKHKQHTKKKNSVKNNKIHDEPAALPAPPPLIDENLEENTDVGYPPDFIHEIPITPSKDDYVGVIREESIKEISIPDPLPEMNEPITLRTNENIVDGPTPIGTSEILKLETDVDKTIENANNVLDVPLRPYQQEDKILEEIVHMISNAPEEVTSVSNDITTKVPTYHYLPDEMDESLLTTLFGESAIKSTMDVITSTTMTPLTDAPEVETIFPSIHAFDEKLPIVIVTTAIEEIVTSEKMPSSSASPSTSSHEHDTTIYSPITTIQTTAEIITSTSEPSTTISTTTPRIVDATVAHVATVVDKVATTPKTTSTTATKTEEESNYDDEYDDDENTIDENQGASRTTTTTTTTQTSSPTLAEVITQQPQLKTSDIDYEEYSQSSTVPTESTSEINLDLSVSTSPSTTEEPELPDETEEDYNEDNQKPFVIKRVKKIQTTSGKPFSYKLDGPIFDHPISRERLTLELLDQAGNALPSNSWIRFNTSSQEIYGLPLEKDVSQHQFKLRATDSSENYADETVDVTVQQHKSFRSVNHEIFIQITLDKTYESAVDWEIRLLRGIVDALDDNSLPSIVVRDVRPNPREENKFTLVYSNDTLPKDYCPEVELSALMARLKKTTLNSLMRNEIIVRTVEKDFITSCRKDSTTPRVSIVNNRNFPPTLRNHVDRVAAAVGELLVYKVPADTFYDPEDQTDLKLTLLNEDRTPLDPSHWLQFDSKNNEFFGVPMVSHAPKAEERYVLVAEDKSGLTANDALVVDVSNPHFQEDYSATFQYQLDMPYELFQTAAMKRKFIERVAQYFNKDTKQIFMKSVRKLTSMGRISVVLQNTTLQNYGEEGCPRDIERKIRKLRGMMVHNDGSVQEGIKSAIGTEFGVKKINIASVGKCQPVDSLQNSDETSHIEAGSDGSEKPFKINEEVLITYVLPSAIILLMLLIALLIACLLYKRRSTGKMELGDEEERKSFRSKGIPVIFQDELDEKPEIVTKSPVILKDEKPPLLPQYNGLNGQNGDEDDLDQYIPPQGLPLMGSRESRGKSPVTPSYRRPPPYVSP